jgi:hypothetical protein
MLKKALVLVVVVFACVLAAPVPWREPRIDFNALVKKGDVYFYQASQKPFTGTATRHNCPRGLNCDDYECDIRRESWEMQDGKFHGRYTFDAWCHGSSGNYKYGKRDGELTSWDCHDGDY